MPADRYYMSSSMLKLLFSAYFTSSLGFIQHDALVIPILVIYALTTTSTSNSASTCAFSLSFTSPVISWVIAKMKSLFPPLNLCHFQDFHCLILFHYEQMFHNEMICSSVSTLDVSTLDQGYFSNVLLTASLFYCCTHMLKPSGVIFCNSKID